MAEFHFLRPWWLLLVPVGAWLIWQLLRGGTTSGGWRSVVEERLRAFVLVDPEVLRDSRLALVASLGSLAIAAFALAGPAWERLPVPAFRSDEALVVALDLSRSMDAGDVEPSRVARAKIKLLDLLERRAAGQTALVVFSTHAFTVTPLTTDTRTISSLVGSVSTNIMPTAGGSLAAGLDKAASLLRQTGLHRGDILLITDSEVTGTDRQLARDLADEGFRVSVLAVGTEQGAPIPKPEGGFVTDDSGNVALPQVDIAALKRLAADGGGRFAALAPDDRDLDSLFPANGPLPLSAELDSGTEKDQEVDVWRDNGAWLAVVLLPLLALTFRRGWIACWLLVVFLPLPRAEAFEWQSLWQRPDQRGYDALESNEPARAAKLFEDPAWRGAAQYRAGEFEASAGSLSGLDSATAHYNRGNALAKAGKLQEAISEYDRALELEPEHADARYNRDLVAKYLEDNPPPEQQPQQQPQSGDQDQNQGDSNESDGSSEQQDDSQSGDSKPSQDDQNQSSDGNAGDDEPDESAQDRESEEQQRANAEQSEEQQGTENAQGPEDVEQWASEQAAEQWLRRVPQDPGGLLRRKFLYQYQRLGVDQDGNPVAEGEAGKRQW